MICPQCGRNFYPNRISPQQKYCSKRCQRRHADGIPPDPKPLQKKSLGEWKREAAECNLDYGTYRAFLDAGKTFDELKASADQRYPLQSHAHKFHSQKISGEKLSC